MAPWSNPLRRDSAEKSHPDPSADDRAAREAAPWQVAELGPDPVATSQNGDGSVGTDQQDGQIYLSQRGQAAPAQRLTKSERGETSRPARRPASWSQPQIGTPGEDFEPRPPVTNSYRPDYLADGWSTPDFTVRMASTRGYVHRFRGIPRQDDLAVAYHARTGAVVFAVADGVSAAPHSHLGSTAACRAAVSAITADLDSMSGRVDWQGVVERAAWQLIEQARALLGSADVTPERAEQELATTLVAGLVRPTKDGPLVTLVQVGDSSAWVLRGRHYRCLLDSKQSMGGEVVASAVTGLPRVPTVHPRNRPLATHEVLLVGTDGVGDPLGDGAGDVAEHLSRILNSPPSPLELAFHLDFSRETFDDDRTLLAIWPRT